MSDIAQDCTFHSESADATFALGEDLGRSLVGGLQIGLVGPLGVGKTHLVKGIAAGNATHETPVATSPTFTLVHEYPGRYQLYHADVYRLRGPGELVALGFSEWLNPASVVVVEWADRVRSVVGDEALWITLQPTSQTDRTLVFEAAGGAAGQCLSRLRDARR